MFVTPKAWALRTGSEPFLYKVFGKKIPKYLAPPIITKRKAILIILALLVLHAIACFMALNLHSSASKEILAFIYLLGIIAISQYSPAIIHWMKVSETQYMEEKKQRENWTNNILFLAKPKHRELWNSIIGAYFSFILLISFSLISVCFFSQGLENPSMSENLVFLTAFYMIFLFWVFCVSVIGPITKFNIVKQLIYMEIEK
ncbi:MAG: hypothetical protein MK052_03875 [Alphaproteobacteria bacterium]|nr:hypothetical protein [Alphaproteobacteria bacterium]